MNESNEVLLNMFPYAGDLSQIVLGSGIHCQFVVLGAGTECSLVVYIASEAGVNFWTA